MRLILFVLVLAIGASGQTTARRIPSDEAAKHVVKKVAPFYPSAAQQGRIQGIVMLEVIIDESGRASVRRLISGHPMLVPAAIDSVNQWKYQPFDVDGKPATVVTFVAVTFTLSGEQNDPPAAKAYLLFEDNFWIAEESAQAALSRGDYTAAEPQLNKARDALASVSDRSYPAERWQWLISMGRLTMGRQKYGEAEPYYKQALELRQSQNGDKDTPEMAATLADLGRLYAEEKRYDLARDHASRSVAIYQKNFKKAGSNHPDTQETYGRAIAYQSWMLSKIALQQNDHIEAVKQCHTVLDFQTFLSTTNHDSFVSICEQAIKGSAPKE